MGGSYLLAFAGEGALLLDVLSASADQHPYLAERRSFIWPSPQVGENRTTLAAALVTEHVGAHGVAEDLRFIVQVYSREMTTGENSYSIWLQLWAISIAEANSESATLGNDHSGGATLPSPYPLNALGSPVCLARDTDVLTASVAGSATLVSQDIRRHGSMIHVEMVVMYEGENTTLRLAT